jgi:SAM-dependent methyltransferase
MINEPKLDLACGIGKREGFFGIDKLDLPDVDFIWDLEKYPWPIESESADEIFCSHYVEHIPHNVNNPNDNRDGFLQFVDECYRILKPGGKLNVIAPYYASMRAFGDPTHTRYICDLSFNHCNKQWLKQANVPDYGQKANFDIKISYRINNEMALKSDEVRTKAFTKDWNAIEDIIFELSKIS